MSGTWWPIFWLIICVIFAYGGVQTTFYTYREKIQQHIADNEIYGKNDLDDDVVLKILDISSTNLRVDNQLFYIVETDDKLVMLESVRDDEDLKYILNNKYELKTGSYYLAVNRVPESERKKTGKRSSRRVYNITPEFLKDIRSSLYSDFETKEMRESNKELVTEEYLSVYKYKTGVNNVFWFGLVMSLISLGIIFIIYKKVKTNIKEFKELEEFYPELTGDFSAISNYAEFKDEKLKIMVYKDGLITYYKGFSITKISDLKSLKIEEFGKKIYISAVYLNKKEERWLIKKYKKETIVRLASFKNFILKNYPSIKVK